MCDFRPFCTLYNPEGHLHRRGVEFESSQIHLEKLHSESFELAAVMPRRLSVVPSVTLVGFVLDFSLFCVITSVLFQHFVHIDPANLPENSLKY